MKTKSIPRQKYIEIINPTYTIYKLTPNTSIRNFKADKIAQVINQCYKNLKDRCDRQDRKLIYHRPAKVAYLLTFENDEINFFFIVPDFRKHLIKEKISGCWKNVIIEEVDDIPKFSKKAIKYQMVLKKEDALSLDTNKVNNELLTNCMNVVDLLEEGDRVAVLYNFIPSGDYAQMGFRNNAKDTLKRFKENKPLDKNKTSGSFIGWSVLRILLSLADGLQESLGSLLGGSKEGDNITESFFKLMQQKALHSSTEDKVNKEAIKTQILVISESEDKNKAETNALSVTEAFKVINEDNMLVPRRTKMNFDFKDYQIGTESSWMSTEEVGANFISLPGKSLIEQFPIDSVNVLQSKITEELTQGYISTGMHDYRGLKTPTYFSNKKNMVNLGTTLIGPQGAGKTTYIIKYILDAHAAGESVIIPDFIKNCETSQEIRKYVPEKDIVRINLADVKDYQGLGFNEVKILDNMTDFETLEIANQQSQQIIFLVDSINCKGDPLTTHMRRYLNAACMVVYIHSSQSLKTVVRVLTDYNTRHQFINKIPKGMLEQLEDDIMALEELDEIDKSGNKGTKSTKIENILARINTLKEDIRLKYMFNKGTEGNIDLIELMDQGKIILIEMPDYKFNTKSVKNVLVTYYLAKIWVSCQMRGYMHKNPPRVHCVLDEIYQAPTAEIILDMILDQARKYQLKFVISCHYLEQIKAIKGAISASGSSYMLFQGSDKNSFEELKSKLYPYTEDDLTNLKAHECLNTLNTTNGHFSFISNLYDERFDTFKKSPK